MGSKKISPKHTTEQQGVQEKTDKILLVKGADGWGSLTAGPIVNGSVVNDRVNNTLAFIFVLGGN